MNLLQEGLHHRNGFVRKGCAALLRMPRGWVRVRHSSGLPALAPAVLANSFPKSGTHLLEQLLAALPDRRNFGTFLSSMTSSYVFRERGGIDTVQHIRRFVPTELARGHLFYEPTFVQALVEAGVVHYFIYRDPRDVVVSESHYLRRMNRWHRLHPYFRQAASDEEAIRLSILGLPSARPAINYPDIGRRFQRYAGWLTSASTYAVRFEDLVSPRRNAVIAEMVRFYAEICAGETNVEEVAARAVERIQPDKSHTYRNGHSGGWRSAFTERHKEQFKQVAGDLLVELGYEESHQW